MNVHMPVRPGWTRLAPAAAWLVTAAATGWVLTFNPTDRVADPTGPCLWHALFGIDGPTCGGTRMFWYLLHGNLIQAARHHLAALIGLLYLGYLLLALTFATAAGKQVRVWKPGRRLTIRYAVAFVVYAVVLRNLPWPPFDWFYVANLV